MQNEAENALVVTNTSEGAGLLVWNDADFTWEEGAGTWEHPYGFANIDDNVVTLTNEAL